MVMFGFAIRAIALLSAQLRAVGLKGFYWQLGLRILRGVPLYGNV